MRIRRATEPYRPIIMVLETLQEAIDFENIMHATADGFVMLKPSCQTLANQVRVSLVQLWDDEKKAGEGYAYPTQD